jgi:hypothetical protein
MKPELLEYAETLQAAGMTVLVPKNESGNYIAFGDDKNVGYCQIDYFVGFSFNTVHKPNASTGTGYQTDEGISTPTLQHALSSFAFAPAWAVNCSTVVKYKGILAYLAKSENIYKIMETKKEPAK